MTLEFDKYQGTGNDFILIDNRAQRSTALGLEEIARLCDRRLGIGADGLILIASHPEVDFQMHYFNADGAPGSMCGNGARCAVKFASNIGMIENRCLFNAYDGLHHAQIDSDGSVLLSMQDVTDLRRHDQYDLIDTGSPHYITFVQDLEAIDCRLEGRQIRNSEQFSAQGINVNFAQAGADSIFLRTYERGVEDLTLSCGTGATATALSFALRHGMESGPVRIETDGGILTIHFEREKDVFRNVLLQGAAEFVYRGRIDL